MAVREIKVKECECDRCGYRWQPKGNYLPKICSRCKSAKWNSGNNDNDGNETAEVTANKMANNFERDELIYDYTEVD